MLAAVAVKEVHRQRRAHHVRFWERVKVSQKLLVLWAFLRMRSRFCSAWGDFMVEIDFQKLPSVLKMFILPKFASFPFKTSAGNCCFPRLARCRCFMGFHEVCGRDEYHAPCK